MPLFRTPADSNSFSTERGIEQHLHRSVEAVGIRMQYYFLHFAHLLLTNGA